MLASWDQYLVTTDRGGIQVQQFAPADITVGTEAGPVHLSMETAYPWEGRVRIEVIEAPAAAWSLSLRIPGWSAGSNVTDPSGTTKPVQAGTYWSSGARVWQPGDTVVLDLDMSVRVTVPDPRIDAVRGCVAFERGPLVYCLETADLPSGVELEEVRVDSDVAPVPIKRADLAMPLIGLTVPALRVPFDGGAVQAIEVGAVPYFAWANRSVNAMRVWVPVRSEAIDPRQ
jgi:DUF1680 family protein